MDTALIGAGEQRVLAVERNLGVILPMSGRRWWSTTGGTHSSGGGFTAIPGEDQWGNVTAVNLDTVEIVWQAKSEAR